MTLLGPIVVLFMNIIKLFRYVKTAYIWIGPPISSYSLVGLRGKHAVVYKILQLSMLAGQRPNRGLIAFLLFRPASA